MCSDQPSHGSCCHGLPRTEDSGHPGDETDGTAEALRDPAATTSDADETTTTTTTAADANDATALGCPGTVQDASHAHKHGHDDVSACTSTHDEPSDEDGGNAGGKPRNERDAGRSYAATPSDASPGRPPRNGPTPRGRGLLPSRCPVPGSPSLPPAGVLSVSSG